MLPNIPSTMQAYHIQAPCGPNALALLETPTPQPRQGELLMRIEAFGINRPDILQREGKYPLPLPPNASPLPGLEAAGEIVAFGEKTTHKPFKIGDKICALLNGGGYARYCAIPVGQCLPIPTGLDMVEAASLPETFFTAWSNLVTTGKLQEGETVLIHGGSSGVGVAAIQIAKALGATVFATAGTEEKCALCESLGASAINYRTEAFQHRILKATHNKGVDLIIDMVGAPYFSANLHSLAPDGRLVIIAVLGGAKANEIDLGLIMKHRFNITGTTLRPRSTAYKAEIAAGLHTHIWPLLEKKAIKPIIYKTFTFEKVYEAQTLMESGQHSGKIVILGQKD